MTAGLKRQRHAGMGETVAKRIKQKWAEVERGIREKHPFHNFHEDIRPKHNTITNMKMKRNQPIVDIDAMFNIE